MLTTTETHRVRWFVRRVRKPTLEEFATTSTSGALSALNASSSRKQAAGYAAAVADCSDCSGLVHLPGTRAHALVHTCTCGVKPRVHTREPSVTCRSMRARYVVLGYKGKRGTHVHTCTDIRADREKMKVEIPRRVVS